MQTTPKKPNQSASKREFPPFYEKALPIAMAVIGLLILVLLGVILYVEFGPH